MEPLIVEVRRNGIVEARHRVHAVAVQNGAVIAEAGDAGFTCFMRSASKPIQALPLARTRADLDERDLAIASASHRATDDQIAAVRALLAKAPAKEDDLELGLQEGRPPEKIFHNCSGKHAGMLALCRAHGWPTTGYRLPEHPVQQASAAAHAEAVQADEAELPDRDRRVRRRDVRAPARAHGLRLRALRAAASGRAGSRHAMRTHPDLVGGPDGADFHLMRAEAGWFAKGGAEGLFCGGGPNGIGIALKSEDGASRPLGPALAAFLLPFGVSLPALATIAGHEQPRRTCRRGRCQDLVTAEFFFTNL